jgi:hypothetical protein
VLQDLLGDPIKFAEAVYLLCGGKPKDDEAAAEFCKGIDGNTLDAMAEAFREELTEFYPPQRRPLLRKIVAKATEATTLLQQRVTEKLDALTPEAVLERMAGRGSPTASRGSSVSTPGPSPSAS